MAFWREGEGSTDILVQDPFAAEPPSRVATFTGRARLGQWTARGLLLVAGGGAVLELRLGGPSGMDSLEVRTLFEEVGVVRPRSDPAGEWITYQVNELSGFGVYVRPVGTQPVEGESGALGPDRYVHVVGWFDEMRRRTGG